MGAPGSVPHRGCLLASSVAAASFALALSQYVAFRARLDVLDPRLALLQREIQQGLIMEAQRPQFEEERQRQAAKLAALRRMLPPVMAADAVQARVRGLATEAGLDASFEGAPLVRVRADALTSAVLRLRACGPERQADALLRELCRNEPLVVVDGVEQAQGCTRALLTTYALARRHGDVEAWPCAPPPRTRAIWLWPWRDRARERERMIEEGCAERARLRPIIEQVRAFLDDKEEIELRTRTVDELTRDGRERAWCASHE